MSITIRDELLKEAGMTDREALVEIASRLFEAGKLTLPLAARLARLDRGEMEEQLLDRKIPLYRPSLEDYRQDVDTLRELRGIPYLEGLSADYAKLRENPKAAADLDKENALWDRTSNHALEDA
jgi:predicted HTH domain antitoxin